MEHPCTKCGSPVENGAPFCPECGAPQIRVVTHHTPEDSEQPAAGQGDNRPATPPLPPGTPAEAQPPAEFVRPTSTFTYTPLPPQQNTRKPFVRAAVLAGVIGGIGLFIPPILVVVMLAAGGIAVTIYTHRTKLGIRAGEGFRLGLLTGFFGTIVWSVLASLSLISAKSRMAVRGEWDRRLQEAMAAAPDEATRHTFEWMQQTFAGTGGLIAMFAIGMLCILVLYLVLAGLGGAVGASLFGRSRTE